MPVDMYFLFDLSRTMEDTLKDLTNIARDLANKIAEITTDRSYGFGIFRDKPLPPFDIKHSYAHDFEHRMKLSPNIDDFINQVRNSDDIIGNIDNPEGSLDALMQILLCKSEIGWRNGTTHIVILITDATFHTAGDGLLGGTWKPYQHTCQLKQRGNFLVYDAIENDYPSLSAVNYELKNQETFLILGVKDYMENYYEQLKRSSSLELSYGIINDKRFVSSSESLKNLILETYKGIKNKMILNKGVHSNNLNINLKFDQNSNCEEEENNDLTGQISCNTVKVDQEINFIAEISITEAACGTAAESFEIKVFGQENSNLKITVSPDCICKCMGHSNSDKNTCSSKGSLECGTCNCNSGSYGDNCECSLEEEDASTFDEIQKKCISQQHQLCNDRGDCICGTCSCADPYFGQFCQCNRNKCNCGEHGDGCECVNDEEACTCKAGWEVGQSGQCDCSTSDDQCKDPFTGLVCNNKGFCKCNQCVECVESEGFYCQQPKAEQFQDYQEKTCETLASCIIYDTFGHILKASGAEADQVLLQKYLKECQETMLKENKRIQCFLSLNETEVGDEVNFDIDSIDQTLDETVITGTTDQCQRASPPDFVKLQQCSTKFKNCNFLFWHDATNGLFGYSNTDFNKKINIYIKYYNKTDNGRLLYNDLVDLDYELTPVLCPSFIDKWIVISSVAGVMFFLFIVGFIVYFVLINLYDKWEYERFKKNAEMVWDIGNVTKNTLNEEKRASKFGDRVRNRMSRMSMRT